MEPIQIVQHEAGAEASRVPVAEIFVNANGIFGKSLSAVVKLPVMVQIVHAHFAASAYNFLAKFGRYPVCPLRNKIKSGTKAEALLQIQQRTTFIQSRLTFHVVHNDESELLPSGPACPTLWLPGG
jgi:hypothetical protein